MLSSFQNLDAIRLVAPETSTASNMAHLGKFLVGRTSRLFVAHASEVEAKVFCRE